MSIETASAFQREIADLVSQVVQDTTGRSVRVAIEDRLIRDGYLDSFSMVSLVLAVQTAYAISIDVTEIEEANFGTVPRLARFVAARRAEAWDTPGSA